VDGGYDKWPGGRKSNYIGDFYFISVYLSNKTKLIGMHKAKLQWKRTGIKPVPHVIYSSSPNRSTNAASVLDITPVAPAGPKSCSEEDVAVPAISK
jgi:hypothetical protein